MRILVSNDDGINAKGLRTLWKSLTQFGEVFVIAPDQERSGTSQAITVHHPIRVDEVLLDDPKVKAWKVAGTPTDCVKMGLETLIDGPIDLVVSGINHGPNLGTDVLYSGTVSAAIEGALHDIPAIAVSLDTWHDYDFQPAADVTVRIIKEVQKKTLPPRTLLNVNVPARPTSELGAIEITILGYRYYQNTFDKRQDPWGRTYYWMGGEILDGDNAAETDIRTVERGAISVTPVHFDLTHYKILEQVKSWQLK